MEMTRQGGDNHDDDDDNDDDNHDHDENDDGETAAKENEETKGVEVDTIARRALSKKRITPTEECVDGRGEFVVVKCSAGKSKTCTHERFCCNKRRALARFAWSTSRTHYHDTD